MVYYYIGRYHVCIYVRTIRLYRPRQSYALGCVLHYIAQDNWPTIGPRTFSFFFFFQYNNNYDVSRRLFAYTMSCSGLLAESSERHRRQIFLHVPARSMIYLFMIIK